MYRFRLSSATLAVRNGHNGRREAVMMPIGTEIAIANLPADGGECALSKLVEVQWDEKTVRIFLVDLLERGERLES